MSFCLLKLDFAFFSNVWSLFYSKKYIHPIFEIFVRSIFVQTAIWCFSICVSFRFGKLGFSTLHFGCFRDVWSLFFFPITTFIWFSTNLCVHLLFKLRIAVFVNVCLFVFGSSILLFYQMFGRCFIPKSTFIRFSKYLCVQFLSKLQFGVFLYVCPFVLGSSVSQHCILDVFEMFGRCFFFL